MGTEEGMSELKAAELELRKAVEVHGTHHPAVLAQLESYVRVCREHGQEAQAQKMEAKADLLRKALAGSPAAVQPGAVQPSAVQPSGVQPSAVQPSAVQPAAVSQAEVPITATSAKAQAALSSSTAAHTVELEDESAFLSPSTVQVKELDRYTEKHLFNSKGEHIAVVFDGDLYSPSGKHMGRWEEDLKAYIDDKGWYFGEIVDGDRIASNPTWQYKHMNFGTKATAGNRSGWQRQADTSRAMLPFGYTDIAFSEE